MIAIKSILNLKKTKDLFNKAIHLHGRFPFTLFCAFSVSVLLICLAALDSDQETMFIPICITCALGVPLFLSLELFNERKWLMKWIPLVIAISFLISFYFLNRPYEQIEQNEPFLIRSLILGITFHLSFAILPYIKNSTLVSFWHYNKTAFTSILSAFLYSLTLFAGLSLALLAIDLLFEVNMNERFYLYLFFIIIGYLNTLIFLSRLPSLVEIDSQTVYPKGLRIFTQYVLLPLVAIYLLILLSYEFKIILQWKLPNGWVSILVIASGIFGTLAFLLLYPLKRTARWIQNFNKTFYWILTPLIALMFVAIIVRIKQYGITEPRYFILILAIWLSCISIYFILSKKDDIRWVPISLIIVGIVSIYGPLSSFNVAYRNQSNRLHDVLINNQMLQNDKFFNNEGLVLDKKQDEKIRASLEYLSKSRPEIFADFLSKGQFEEFINSEQGNKEIILARYLGLEGNNSFKKRTLSISRPASSLEQAYNADYILLLDGPYLDTLIQSIDSDEVSFLVRWQARTQIELQFESDSLYFNFDAIANPSFQSSLENLTFYAESDGWQARLVLDSFFSNAKEKEGDYLRAKIYLSEKTKMTRGNDRN